MASSPRPPVIGYGGGQVPDDVTTGAPAAAAAAASRSVAVLTLIVVASLCAVVGAVYLLIYFKSIEPTAVSPRCAETDEPIEQRCQSLEIVPVAMVWYQSRGQNFCADFDLAVGHSFGLGRSRCQNVGRGLVLVSSVRSRPRAKGQNVGFGRGLGLRTFVPTSICRPRFRSWPVSRPKLRSWSRPGLVVVSSVWFRSTGRTLCLGLKDRITVSDSSPGPKCRFRS